MQTQTSAPADRLGQQAGGYSARNLNYIGYTILNNGDGVCLLFPFVPGASTASIEGGDVHIGITGGEVVLLDVGSAALQAAAAGKLLVVGIDALSRPVFEYLVTLPGGTSRLN